MKSFKNKQTGVILTPKNKWVEEQLEANSSYEVVGAKASTKPAGEKAIKIKSMLKYRRKKCFFYKKCTKSLLILIQKSKKKISAMKMAFYAKRD